MNIKTGYQSIPGALAAFRAPDTSTDHKITTPRPEGASLTMPWEFLAFPYSPFKADLDHRLHLSQKSIEELSNSIFTSHKTLPQYGDTSPLLRGSVIKALNQGTATTQEIKDFADQIYTVRTRQNRLTGAATNFTQEQAHLESQAFFHELKANLSPGFNTLKTLRVSEQGQKVCQTFASYIMPMMALMGFPDAISHAAQVARLCALDAKEQGGTEQEVVQAFMVGLAHDMAKVPGSFPNLLTHPASVSAIVGTVLTKPEMQASLSSYLRDSKKVSHFKTGLSLATAVNNDSDFICKKIAAEIGKQLDEKGAESADSKIIPTDIEKIKAAIQERFDAIAEGKRPPRFSIFEIFWLNKVKIGTGFYKPNQKEITLSGLEVLVNSLELQNQPGSKAAQALTTADQLGLALGKLMAQNTKDNGSTPRARATSYMTADFAFPANVKGVAQYARPQAEELQSKLYFAILTAVEELTGNNLQNQLSFNFQALEPKKQSDILSQIVSKKENWITAGGKDLGDIDLSVLYADSTASEDKKSIARDQQSQIATVISKHYNQAIEDWMKERELVLAA